MTEDKLAWISMYIEHEKQEKTIINFSRTCSIARASRRCLACDQTKVDGMNQTINVGKVEEESRAGKNLSEIERGKGRE